MVIWRSLIDVYCVCSKRPQITSRPDPRSGARSGKGNRFFDQNNICSSWCECPRPIRKVRGKPPIGLAVYHTSAEVCGEQLHGCAVPIHLMLDSAPCVLLVGLMPLCVPFFGHIPSSQLGWYAFVAKLMKFSLRQDLLLTGVADSLRLTTSWGCSG